MHYLLHGFSFPPVMSSSIFLKSQYAWRCRGHLRSQYGIARALRLDEPRYQAYDLLPYKLVCRLVLGRPQLINEATPRLHRLGLGILMPGGAGCRWSGWCYPGGEVGGVGTPGGGPKAVVVMRGLSTWILTADTGFLKSECRACAANFEVKFIRLPALLPGPYLPLGG